jgi:hypothetical protein
MARSFPRQHHAFSPAPSATEKAFPAHVLALQTDFRKTDARSSFGKPQFFTKMCGESVEDG